MIFYVKVGIKSMKNCTKQSQRKTGLIRSHFSCGHPFPSKWINGGVDRPRKKRGQAVRMTKSCIFSCFLSMTGPKYAKLQWILWRWFHFIDISWDTTWYSYPTIWDGCAWKLGIRYTHENCHLNRIMIINHEMLGYIFIKPISNGDRFMRRFNI